MNDTEIKRAKELFAALITRADHHDISEVMWYNACGLGPIEDSWDEFQEAFETIFGMTWDEAEKIAKDEFDPKVKREYYND